MVIAINEKQWRGLLEATGLVEEVSQIEGLMRLDFSTEGDRFKAREELCRLLEPWFARQTLQTVEEVFTNCGICWDKYQTVTELVTNDPDCSPANPVFEEIEQPGIGRYPVSSGAMHFSKIERSSPQPAPILGNHTDEILADILKLDSNTIGKLHDNRIVA